MISVGDNTNRGKTKKIFFSYDAETFIMKKYLLKAVKVADLQRII